jgi:hypothetical protein
MVKRFAEGQVAADAPVVTDAPGSYHGDSAGRAGLRERRPDEGAEARERCAAVCQGTILLLTRWLLGTHAGAAIPDLQAYPDKIAFRHNGRKTNGVERIAARVIERLVGRLPLTMRSPIDDTKRCR